MNMKFFFGGTVVAVALLVSFAVHHRHVAAQAAEQARVAQAKRAVAEAIAASAADQARIARAELDKSNAATAAARAELDRSNAVTAAARTKISAMLKDPDSAQFKDLMVTSAGAVCGKVNAKNGMGGYNGFRPFLVYEDTTAIYTDLKTSSFDESRMNLDYLLVLTKSGC